MTIDMKPNRDCLVREGRVDIVLEERWTEKFTYSYEQPIGLARGSVSGIGTETVTKEVEKETQGDHDTQHGDVSPG